MLVIDGSQGEGGGQVLRTSLSLAALTGRPFRLTNIRAGRSKPGLRPQHVTAVRAVAAICQAEVEGVRLNARSLTFRPQSRPRGGSYRFDVADAAQGGSAGSITLIWQALVWPLLFAEQPAHITLHGGTHVPFSPPFHYLQHVALPAFARLGARLTLTLDAWGWYPQGGGQMKAAIEPVSGLQATDFEGQRVTEVAGVAAVTNLPSHIPNRMARRADNLLRAARLQPHIDAVRERGAGPGAGIFLWLLQAGFSSLGRRGLPADKVAEKAVAQCLTFLESETAVDAHLADQLLLPLALAQGTSCLTTHTLTTHTLTNAQLLRQWLEVPIEIDGELERAATITVHGVGFTAGLFDG